MNIQQYQDTLNAMQGQHTFLLTAMGIVGFLTLIPTWILFYCFCRFLVAHTALAEKQAAHLSIASYRSEPQPPPFSVTSDEYRYRPKG